MIYSELVGLRVLLKILRGCSLWVDVPFDMDLLRLTPLHMHEELVFLLSECSINYLKGISNFFQTWEVPRLFHHAADGLKAAISYHQALEENLGVYGHDPGSHCSKGQ